MHRRALALAAVLGIAAIAGLLLLTHGSGLQVTVTMNPTSLHASDQFMVHAELRNPGPFTVQIREQTCEPLQIEVLNSFNKPVWKTNTFCPFTWTPGLIQVKPGQRLQVTECMHYAGSSGSCSGYDPALPIGHYTLAGTYYGQPLPRIPFDVVGANG